MQCEPDDLLQDRLDRNTETVQQLPVLPKTADRILLERPRPLDHSALYAGFR
jgi:hypothetical protein